MLTVIDLMSRAFLKVRIFFHKLINWPLYRDGVILYGVPRMIYRNKIRIGKGAKINESVFLHGAGGIDIGTNTTLSYGTVVLSTGYDMSAWDTEDSIRKHNEEKIVIGKNVWIGANVTILAGVTIADNTVIGAGALVNKSVLEPGYIYAGVPAKKIKKI